MKTKSRFGKFIEGKLKPNNITVDKFLKKTLIPKTAYYQLKKDDSTLEIGQIKRMADLFGMSYVDIQIELGRISELDMTYPMSNEHAEKIINANYSFFINHGLDPNLLTECERKDLAIKLDIQLKTLSSLYSKKIE